MLTDRYFDEIGNTIEPLVFQIPGIALHLDDPDLRASVHVWSEVGIDLVFFPSGKLHSIHTMIVDELQYREYKALQATNEAQQHATTLHKAQ